MKEATDELSWLFQPRYLLRLIAGAFITGLLAMFFFSPLFVKPLYQSEALIYVPLTLFKVQYEQQGVGFASDHEIAGHIQILRSSVILDSLACIYGLIGENGPMEFDPVERSRLHKSLNSRISIDKNRYHSVSVKVKDTDPQRAADMANDIVRLGDVVKNNMLIENKMAAVNFAKEQYLAKQKELEVTEKSMHLIFSGERNLNVEEMIEMKKAETIYYMELEELLERKNYYHTLLQSMETSLPHSYIISPAVASFDIVWPKRWIISLALAFGFVILYIFYEILKKDAV
ncbi:MAG: hypothetical protein WD577_10460 [Bacteroidales bacterium]